MASSNEPRGPDGVVRPWRTDPGYLDRIRHILPPAAESYQQLDPLDLASVTSLVAAEVEAATLPDDAKALFRDLAFSLAPAFLPAGSVSAFRPNEAVGNEISASARGRVIPPAETVFAVQYNTVHAGDYGSILATYRQIDVEAILVRHPSGRVSRYIDWNFVMAQLGIVGTQRPVLGRNAVDDRGHPIVRSVDDDEPYPGPPHAAPPVDPPLTGLFGRLAAWLCRRLLCR